MLAAGPDRQTLITAVVKTFSTNDNELRNGGTKTKRIERNELQQEMDHEE